MRQRRFNRGAWQMQRERFQIGPGLPPPEEHVVSIEQVVPSVLKSAGLERNWQQHAVVESWASIVGPQIAAQTRPAQLQDGVLTVFVTHPVWLNELERFHKETILRRLQERCPTAKVRKLRFQIDSDSATPR